MRKIITMLLIAAICLTAAVSCKSRKKEIETETGGSSARQTEKTTTGSETPTVTTTGSGAGTTAATGGEVTDPGIDPEPTDPTDPTPRPNDTDEALFSAGDISVYFREIAPTSLRKEIVFFVSNSGEKTVTVEISVLTVNRYAMSESARATLIPSSAAMICPNFWQSDLDRAGITDITEVTVTITAKDSSRTPVFEDQTITFRI